jgi:hypothetical protein
MSISHSLRKKALEISVALARVGAYIQRDSLKIKIEERSLDFLTGAGSENYKRTLEDLDILSSLINFGAAMYEIEPINAKEILREIEDLYTAIRHIAGLPENGSVSLERVFSKDALKSASSAYHYDEADKFLSNGFVNGNENKEENGNKTNNKNGNGNGNGINAVVRHSYIIDKIRQSDDRIQLKDLMAEFPDVSERTLRYDLQKLCGRGLIERVGNGGPATYYTAKGGDK